MNKSGFPLSLNFYVRMRKIYKKEAIYGRSHRNVEVEPCSTSMDGLSYTASILLTPINFMCICT